MPLNDILPADLVRTIIQKKLFVDLESLKVATGGRSQASLFRDLTKLSYLTSYTHAGRFYTLPGIPKFDAHRLWFHQGVGFSEFGTLKNTAFELVNGAPAGYLHHELEAIVRTLVHNPLLELCREGSLRRESLGPRKWLYLSADPTRGEEQLQARHILLAADPLLPTSLLSLGSLDVVIAILVETIHSAKQLPTIVEVSRRLGARDIAVLPEQVLKVWSHYGLDRQKKTVASTRKPSKT
jgi:hypothetical protein